MEIKDIEKLAKLSRLELTEEEKVNFAKDLESILHYVDQIREVVIDDTASQAGSTVGDIYNVLREDGNAHESGQFSEKIMKEVPDTQDGFVKVKQIL
ncbi:MAG: hypothetical protein RL641_598 [Candidatus Parcubacteria bacterium]|jgi:aspartyl-tRNA(Asn)/glutamyl-tRNA(Gln) amidotransferase subunit C